jgi:hypothetical protein
MQYILYIPDFFNAPPFGSPVYPKAAKKIGRRYFPIGLPISGSAVHDTHLQAKV